MRPRKPETCTEDAEDVRSQLRAAALARSLSEARIKQAEADLKEMQRDREAGDLLRREDVDFVLRDFGAMMRIMLDGRAERLGAELGLTPQQTVSLSESDEQMLRELAYKLNDRAKNSLR